MNRRTDCLPHRLGSTLLALSALFGCGLGFFGCSSSEAEATAGGDRPAVAADAGASTREADASVDRPPPLAGDALPTGAISFFNRTGCPAGWEPFAQAQGRTVVPGGAAAVLAVQGEPLADSEERKHQHGVSARLPVPQVSYAGIAGEANHNLGRGGDTAMVVKSEKSVSALPYVQLLVCKKSASPITTRTVPAGTLMFFSAAPCPNGWGQPMTTRGRFLVGLPEKGAPGQPFGGPPLADPGPTAGPLLGERRTHHHLLQGRIKTTAHGIALISSGAADGYAKHGEYIYRANSSEESVDFPYLQLLQCQKL